jgi:glyoxylase-like metal-dependent hydrolase (beta-lactamase superfamily II)
MTGTGNNTYLCSRLLVDAGVGKPAHVDAIAGALGDEPLERVIVTHGHADHASGVPALRARWPQDGTPLPTVMLSPSAPDASTSS